MIGPHILIVWHPIATAITSLIVFAVTAVAVVRCRPSVRLAALVAAASFAAAVTVRGIWEAKTIVRIDRFIDRKTFVWLPVREMLMDMQSSAGAQDWQVLTQQLAIFHANWTDIAMGKTTDVWALQERIRGLDREDANEASEAIGAVPAPQPQR